MSAIKLKTSLHVIRIGVIGLMLATAPAMAQEARQPHKAFVLIEYQVRDKPLFEKLRGIVRASLTKYKGDLVTREKVQPIFGTSATNLSVISFAKIEDARTWLASKEMAALATEREKAAQVTTYLVEKLD